MLTATPGRGHDLWWFPERDSLEAGRWQHPQYLGAWVFLSWKNRWWGGTGRGGRLSICLITASTTLRHNWVLQIAQPPGGMTQALWTNQPWGREKEGTQLNRQQAGSGWPRDSVLFGDREVCQWRAGSQALGWGSVRSLVPGGLDGAVSARRGSCSWGFEHREPDKTKVGMCF